MKRLFRALVLGVVVLSFQGCVSTSEQYYWGSYEKLVYDMYAKPGKATPEVQIEKLTTDISRAEAKGKNVPPGIYAHLGFMYAAAGYSEKSKSAFNSEMGLYPESRILIQGMLDRAQQVESQGELNER